MKICKFEGTMCNYTDVEINAIIDSLPPSIGYLTWNANGHKKIRLIAKRRLVKNTIVAKAYAPLPPVSYIHVILIFMYF